MEINREIVEQGISDYCVDIQDPSLPWDTPDYLRRSGEFCDYYLGTLYTMPDLNLLEVVHRDSTFAGIYSTSSHQKAIWALESHLSHIQKTLPLSMDALLNFSPASWNPIKMITSSLTHGDRLHLIGNLLFFFAFAPAVEILIANTKRYLLALLSIALCCGLADSLVSLATLESIPTLGLSGVVMGVIGMSAYLMPHARIRTFVWLAFYMRICWIPAWILALWYIGFDLYDLFSDDRDQGINFLAHVVGGICGYFLAKEWFKERREEFQEELDDEIEFMKSERYRFGIASTFASKRVQDRMANEQWEHHARRKYADYVQKLHEYITAQKDSEAIVLFLENYDFYYKSPEIYEQLFDEMKLWPNSRALLCLGRLVIERMIQDKQYIKAMAIARHCIETNENFVLADPNIVAFFVKECLRQGDYKLAYALVTCSERRYVDKTLVTILLNLEADILDRHLGRHQDAVNIRQQLATL
jgi:membrane associated rhomboid family serine protease